MRGFTPSSYSPSSVLNRLGDRREVSVLLSQACLVTVLDDRAVPSVSNPPAERAQRMVTMSEEPGPLSTAATYDEQDVPAYELPAVVPSEGVKWSDHRQQMLQHFSETVYGQVPQTPYDVSVINQREQPLALGGLAVRSELTLRLTTQRGTLDVTALLTLPKQSQPVPALLGCNFAGNHTTTPDPWVSLPTNPIPNRSEEMVMGPAASDAGRGCLARRWPMSDAIVNGIGVITVYSGDFDFDGDDAFVGGVHNLLQDPSERDASSWGTIAGWAWGLSRVLDAVIAAEPRVDGQRVGTIGHSRMGKTALWAAAQDERFALAISNNAGCTGATLSRRCIGERLHHINERFPHWFAKNYRAFNHREHELPIDQHQLLALLAPRPVYVGSASGDSWADPRGEFAACQAASVVYDQFGKIGLGEVTMPAENQSVGDHMRYHIRPGSHDILPQDWYHYLQFARQHFGM